MPTYDVELVDRSGGRRSTVIEGANEDEVVEGLRDLGLCPIKIQQSKEEVIGVTIEEMLEERRQRDQVLQTTETKLKEMHQRFIDGDDGAFDELQALMRIIVSEPEVYPAPMRAVWGQVLERYERAGNAEAIRAHDREHQENVDRAKGGDAKAFSELGLPQVAPGWLATDQGERFGALHLGANGDLAFLVCDERSGEPRSVISLCPFEDFESGNMAGLLTKRFELRAVSGKSWTIRLDKQRMRHAHRSVMSHLHRIIQSQIAAKAAH